MSRTIVERLSRVIDERASRRGFLSRTAVGATAMAVAPATYALKPTTAEAAVTGHADFCGADGYTDFCCLLTGQNLCPPNTVVAGWWKANGSGWCDLDGPKPRYYLDCNHTCSPGCGCGASGLCSSSCTAANCRCPAPGARRVDCTRFRYGQCNQDIACVGPIACRIVTCVPPWQWDTSCTTASATDNRTAFHDRACLHDGFTDLAPGAFYTEPVNWMVAEGITTGYNDDLFGPGLGARREHFATFLWRYAGEPPPPEPVPPEPPAPGDPAPPEPTPPPEFSDVPGGAYYAAAVEWMVAAGITEGTTDTTFSPEAWLTRAQAITFMWRFAGAPDVEPTHTFADVPPNAYYAPAVAWGYATGVTLGVTDAHFGGEQRFTRGEAAAFLHRYDQLVGQTS